MSRTMPQAARGRRQHQQAASLPLDIVVEIAACSDPATLVRCAATCWEMRRRVADDPDFRRRLRLRHADRFVPSLLRGFFAGQDDYFKNKSERYLVDTTAADATKVRSVNLGVGFGPTFPTASVWESRNGLVLLVSVTGKELRVCDPATGRSHDLPSEPPFPAAGNRSWQPSNYVLLTGDTKGGGAGAVGRPFRLLNAKIDLSRHQPHLQIHTFSSTHDTWGACTEIPIPNFYASYVGNIGRALVVGDAVHWLCPTDGGFYLIKLHVRSAQVTISELPESIPRDGREIQHHLLAMTSPRGSPIVLVSEGGKILAWSQSKHTMQWKQQPQVTDVDELVRFALSNGGKRPLHPMVKLHWFTERSGLVLIEIRDCGHSYGFIWLDLQSMGMVRWFSDPFIEPVCVYGPYEIDLSSWIPNFSSTL